MKYILMTFAWAAKPERKGMHTGNDSGVPVCTKRLKKRHATPGTLPMLASLACMTCGLAMAQLAGGNIDPPALWPLVNALPNELPLAINRIQDLTSTKLTEDRSASNAYFQFYQAINIPLKDGIRISKLDLRLRRDGLHPGFLVLEMDGTCVSLDEVRKHLPQILLMSAPRGHSLDEARTYTSAQNWGSISFGFKERNTNCLAYIAFAPTQNR